MKYGHTDFDEKNKPRIIYYHLKARRGAPISFKKTKKSFPRASWWLQDTVPGENSGFTEFQAM